MTSPYLEERSILVFQRQRDAKKNLNKQALLSVPQFITLTSYFFSSVHFSHSVVSNSLQPHELQQAKPSCPSSAHRVYPNPCPSSQLCHPTISSSVISFSLCPQSFPASGSFPMNLLFTSGGQSIWVWALASFLSKKEFLPRADLLQNGGDLLRLDLLRAFKDPLLNFFLFRVNMTNDFNILPKYLIIFIVLWTLSSFPTNFIINTLK